MATYAKKFGYSILGLLAVVLAGWYLFEKYIGTVNIPEGAPVEVNEEEGTPETVAGMTVPSGFSLKIFADKVPGARALEFDPNGRILVSQTSEGKITALTNAGEKIEVITGLNGPHGMAFQYPCPGENICKFYVAEKNQLSVFDYDSDTAKASNKQKLLDLPAGSVGTHFTRSLLFLPSPEENILLISIGSSCNVCNESDKRRASIQFYNVSTGESGEYAKGLRNSVFMTLHPVSGKVFATEMGRDNLGDNIPPDEINIIERGKNYGWPLCYGKNIIDTNFHKDDHVHIRADCSEPFETPSYIDLQAHSAPLGLAFIPEEGWAEDMWYDLLVAYHGSWNRSTPTGYKIVRLRMDAEGRYQGTEDFITGWLTANGEKSGRPVDIKVLPGGVVYISDDHKGVIYRLARGE